MIRNVGSVDKIIRLVAGAALAVFGFTAMGASGMGLVAIVVGIVLIATALLNFCPLFKILGISSAKS